jgi:hypothetical protein
MAMNDRLELFVRAVERFVPNSNGQWYLTPDERYAYVLECVGEPTNNLHKQGEFWIGTSDVADCFDSYDSDPWLIRCCYDLEEGRWVR